MGQLPRRVSLAQLTADSIKESILRGEWERYLPSERSLSDSLQVSRRTVRMAIQLLHDEGWIISEKGQRQKIRRKRKQNDRSPSRVVNLLLGDGMIRSFEFLFYIDETRRLLQKANYTLEIVWVHGLNAKNPGEILTKIVAKHPARAWILCSLSFAVHQWFEAQGLPSLIFGTTRPGVNSPSLAGDLYAAGNHAANLFLSLGHRQLLCLLPASAREGALVMKEGFEDAVHKHRNAADICADTEYFKRDMTTLSSRVTGLLLGKSYTAILVASSDYALAVVSYLIQKGIRVPEDISVISFGDGHYLRYFVPSISRYYWNSPLITRKLVRMALQLCNQGKLDHRKIFFMPDFEKGNTLARCRLG